MYHAPNPVGTFYKEYPVSHGHAPPIPRRHLTDLLDGKLAEQLRLLSTLPMIKGLTAGNQGPEGSKIAKTTAVAGMPTVLHLHPRLNPPCGNDPADLRRTIRAFLLANRK